MIRNFCIVAILAVVVSGAYGNHLIGEHVCTRNETYTVTFEKPIRKNITKREFVWCASLPPRCSKYITEEVDAIKIVEENRVKKVDICCDGFAEEETRTYCIPVCNNCMNGACTAPELCSCSAGYIGASCNQSCEAGLWGQNCSQKCACVNGASCSSETGNCTCVPGTTGPKCEISLFSNDASNCSDKNCDSFQPTVKKETKEPVLLDIAILPTESLQSSTSGSIEKSETTTHFQEEIKEIIDNNASLAKSKKNFNSIGKIPQFSGRESEKWQMDQILIEDSSENSVKDTLLVFVISIAIGIAVILILVMIMTIMIARYKKQRDLAIKNVLSIRSSIDSNKNRLSTEPIIHRSVFHAPLPDPPIFHNPVFTLQDLQCSSKIQASNRQDTPPPELQPQYDFPPSSGSYRAVSLPDPSLEAQIEPVYDEIPASRRPRPVSVIAECRKSRCENPQCQWNNT